MSTKSKYFDSPELRCITEKCSWLELVTTPIRTQGRNFADTGNHFLFFIWPSQVLLCSLSAGKLLYFAGTVKLLLSPGKAGFYLKEITNSHETLADKSYLT